MEREDLLPRPAYLPGQDKLDRHYTRWEEAKDASQNQKREMFRDMQVLRGDVFSDKEKEVFKNQDREPPNYPLALPMVNVVCGTEGQNRTDVKIYPVGPGDVDGAKAMTQVIRKESRDVDLQRKLSQQFRHAVSVGIGWIRTGFSSYIDAPSELSLEVPDPLDVWVDPASRNPDLSDAKDLFVRKFLTPVQLARIFPQFSKEIAQLKGVDADYLRGLWHSADYANQTGDYPNVDSDSYQLGDAGHHRGRQKLIEAVERWYRIDRWIKAVKHKDGRYWEVGPTVNQDLLYWLSEQVLDGNAFEIEGMIRDIRYAMFAENLLLGDFASPHKHRRFPIVPMWGYQDEYGSPFGLVRVVRSAVKDFNARTANLLNRALKRQVWVEENAVDDIDKMIEEMSYSDGVITLKPGAISRNAVIFKDDLQASPLEGNLLSLSQRFVSDQAGVTEEMAGQKTNVESGVGIRQKISQSQTALYNLFDNRSWTQKTVAELMISDIQQVYTAEMAVRITENTKGVEWIFINKQDPTTGTILNDIRQATFDIEVGAVPMSANDRMAQFEALAQFLAPMPPEVKLLFASKMATLADIPDSEDVARKIEEFVNRMLGGQGGAPGGQEIPTPDQIAAAVEAGQISPEQGQQMLAQLAQMAQQGPPPPPAPQAA